MSDDLFNAIIAATDGADGDARGQHAGRVLTVCRHGRWPDTGREGAGEPAFPARKRCRMIKTSAGHIFPHQ